jgi:membrane protein implicated in regulation of membrane protease activity
MELNVILLIILLVMYPVVYFHGSYAKASVVDQPLIFSSTVFVFFCNLTILAFVILSIYLLYVSWKTFLLLLLIIAISGFLKGLFQR